MSIVKGVPDVPAATAPPLFQFLGRIKEIIEVRIGARGSKYDVGVTFQDLIDLGIIEKEDVK